MMLSAVIVYQMGSSLPTLISLGIQLFFQEVLGCGRETSLLVGNMGAALVHTTQELTMWNTGVVGVAVLSSYVGSKCGFWLGKKAAVEFDWNKPDIHSYCI